MSVPRRPISLLVLVLFALSLAPAAAAQDNGTEPEPYSPDEFPGWARDLRRGEIIALGSFPVVLLLSNIGYDLVRFGVESWRAGEWNYTYAPWFFGPPDKPPLTEDERIGVIATAAGISVGVALLDFVIGRMTGRGSASGTRSTPSAGAGSRPAYE
jgi:hypothetical protein